MSQRLADSILQCRAYIEFIEKEVGVKSEFSFCLSNGMRVKIHGSGIAMEYTLKLSSHPSFRVKCSSSDLAVVVETLTLIWQFRV